MKIIGITGGVGSGKTELLNYIKEHYNCRIILADRAAEEVEMPGTECYKALKSLLMENMADGIASSEEEKERILLNEDGTLNRPAVASIVFSDPSILEKVNAIVHPAVHQYVEDAIAKEKERGVLDLFFVEAALLIEAGYAEVVDEMWYIYCRRDVRFERLKAGRGYSDEKIESIMKNQLSEEEFRRSCRVVIDNSAELDDAYRQIDENLKQILSNR